MSGLHTVPVGGMLAFNMTTGKWINSSMPSELVRPRAENIILSSVPNFGPVGLLLVAGVGTADDALRKVDNITIYEPSDKTRHYQTTAGNILVCRYGICNVDLQGDNRTYEM